MNFRTLIMCTVFICMIILTPFTVLASNGKAPDHSKADENKEAVEQKRETPSPKQNDKKKDKAAKASAHSKADPKPKSKTQPSKPEPTSKAPDYSKNERSENSSNKGQSEKVPKKKREDRGSPPDHAKADKENENKVDKRVEDQIDQELPMKEEVVSESQSSSPLVQHVEREGKQNSSKGYKDNSSSDLDEAQFTKEAKVRKKPVQKPLPTPERPPAPQPVEDGVTFSYSPQKTGSKSGKDRAFSQDTTVWTAVNMTLSSGGQDLRYILVSRHHMLRNQWMNAPPGQPPKMSPLFS